MRRAKTKIENRSQKHSCRNIFSSVAAVRKVTHDELPHSVGNRGATQNIPNHYLVIMEGLPHFLGHRGEIIANHIEGGVRDERCLENLPAKFWVKPRDLVVGQPGLRR